MGPSALVAAAALDETTVAAHRARLPLDAFDLEPGEVRSRIRWAARQGQPHWLWPDVAVADWANALERIAEAAGEVLTEGRSRSVLDGDAAAMSVTGYTSGMGPLLGYWLETGRISASAPVTAIFALHLEHNRQRMQMMATQAVRISEAMARDGIEHTFIKGMHTAFKYFPEPGTRPMSDIDLLVARSDRERADRVLAACDFEPGIARTLPTEQNWRLRHSPRDPRTLCFVHAQDPWSIDLHVSLDRRYSAASPILHLDRAARAALPARSLLAPEANVLAQPALLLNTAVHTGCGLGNLTLLRLVELVLMIRKDFAAGPASWEAFIGAANRADALACAYPALKFCDELVPGTVPAEVIARSRRQVPHSVRTVVDPLRVANAQRLLRCSLAERFMWTPSRWGIAWQLFKEVLPPGWNSAAGLIDIYRARFWRLARRTLSS